MLVVHIIGLTDICRDHGTADVINFTEDICEILLNPRRQVGTHFLARLIPIWLGLDLIFNGCIALNFSAIATG